MEKADAFKKSRRVKTVGVSSNLTVYLLQSEQQTWPRVRVFAASSSVALHDVMSVWAGSQRDLTF